MPWVETTLWSRRSVRNMLYGVASLLGVVVYGSLGFIALGWSPIDAIYMVFISVSTVGYSEVQPLDTTVERVHVMVLIAMGSVALAYTVGNLVAFITEGEIQTLLGRQRIMRQIQELKQHVIVAGYGRMGAQLCEELIAANESVLVIERDPALIEDLRESGLLYIDGDATEEDVLNQAGLARARALVTTINSDSDSVFITLTARQMVPSVEIIARAEQPSTVKKLRQAGANHVVLPSSIGAHRIASLLTKPSALQFAELVTRRASLEIQLEEFRVHEASVLRSKTLREADIGRRTGAMVIALKWADGTVEFPAASDRPLEVGDVLVVLGRAANLDHFRVTFTNE